MASHIVDFLKQNSSMLMIYVTLVLPLLARRSILSRAIVQLRKVPLLDRLLAFDVG